MNFKKIVSAASALTIAASAFASMAVVANAAYEAKYSRELSTWSETDLTDWVASGATASVDATNGLTTTTKNGAFTFTKDTSSYVNANDKVKVTGTFFTGGPSGRNTSYGYLKIGEELELRGNTQAQSSSIVINGTETSLDINARNHEFTFTVEFDTQLKQLTSFVVDGVERISSNQALDKASLNSVVMGHHRGGSGSYETRYSLKDLKIETEAQAVAATGSYVINYAYGDQTLKSASGTTVVGTAPIVDMDDFTIDDQKYACDSNDLNNAVITTDHTAENPLVVTVTCTPYTKVTEATVKYVVGSEQLLEEKVAIDAFVGDTVNVPFRHYFVHNGELYSVARNNSNPYYGQSTTVTDTTEITKTAEKVTIADGETFVTMVDADGDSSNSADIRASNMSATRDDITLGDVTPGIYKIVYNQYIRGGNPILYINDEEVCALNNNTGSWGEATTEGIVITKPGTLVIKNPSMTDYVLLYKTGDVYAPQAIQVTTDLETDSYNTLTLNLHDSDIDKDGTATYTFGTLVTISKDAAVFYKITGMPAKYQITGSSVSYVE